MKNREYFLRDDIKTYKKKFLLLCNPCAIDNISPKTFAQKENKSYIRQIEIKEI